MGIHWKEIAQGLTYGRVFPRSWIEERDDDLLEEILIADGGREHEFGEGDDTCDLDRGVCGGF